MDHGRDMGVDDKRPASDSPGIKDREESGRSGGVDGKKSSAGSLLKFAGAWSGDDLELRLAEAYRLRGETKF